MNSDNDDNIKITIKYRLLLLLNVINLKCVTSLILIPVCVKHSDNDNLFKLR